MDKLMELFGLGVEFFLEGKRNLFRKSQRKSIRVIGALLTLIPRAIVGLPFIFLLFAIFCIAFPIVLVIEWFEKI